MNAQTEMSALESIQSSGAYKWIMEDTNSFAGWESVGGPVVLLVGLGLSILGNWLYGGMIGDVSCRYRLSYSPKNGAFGIWGVIYPYMIASILFQFLYSYDSNSFYVARFWSNLLLFVAWTASGAWTFFFGVADSPNPEVGLGFAAFFLLLAAITALSAVFVEQGFRADASWTRILTVSIPFSLYAGWLIVAASINVGIFVTISLNSNDTIALCERDPGNQAEPLIPDPRGWVDASLPLVLAAVVSVLSITQFDFVLILPIIWAISFMKPDNVKIVSIIVACLSLIVSIVLFYQSRLGR